MSISVYKVAKWFIKNDYDNPRNKYDGNMKLQKLLYFAQLIHLKDYDEILFEEPIYAFKKGPVVECIRLEYRNNCSSFIKEAKQRKINLNNKIMSTLKKTVKLFGDLSANKLSDITHEHKCWENALKKSNINGFYDKNKSIISIEEIKKHALEKLEEYIKAKEMTAKTNTDYEVVNGTKFYYDPENIQISEDILNQLEDFNAEEDAYTLYKDPSQGIVIY